MLAYLIRRLLQSILVLFIVIVITFTLPYFQPGGILAPAYIELGTHISHQAVMVWAAQNGMDHPYLVRLWEYLVQLIGHGNLGYSYRNNQSVWSIISLFIPRTIWLALSSFVLTLLIAIPLGMYQARRRNTFFDYTATGVAFFLYAMPAFLLCLLMIQIFSFGISHLPSVAPTGVAPWAMFTNPVPFILPVACLTLLSVAGLSRFMRGSVLEVLVQDYIRTARAKGASSRRVLFKHAFRNALGPIITLLGLSLPALFGGALIIEEVFNYQGLGYETVVAAQSFDIPTVIGITLLISVFTLLGNLLADIGLGIVSPRIRIEQK